MKYMIFIINYIHHLMNESKIQSSANNSDTRVYEIFSLKKDIYSFF